MDRTPTPALQNHKTTQSLEKVKDDSSDLFILVLQRIAEHLEKALWLLTWDKNSF